jgi:DNA-binding response OmpR family regulator
MNNYSGMRLMLTKKVYIVEDDRTFLGVYLAVLDQMENVEVFYETIGDKGFDLIKAGDPDLCILDYKLPGMDGVAICKELRKLPKFQKIPIIIVSSSPIRGNKQEIFEEAGFDRWYEKPLNLKEFKENISSLLF